MSRAWWRCGALIRFSETNSAGSAAGSSRGWKREPAGPRALDAVHAVGPPRPAVAVPGDEVPAAAEVHERVRLGQPPALAAVARPVAEADALAVARRRRDDRERLGVDGRPAARHGRRDRLHRLHAPAQVRGEDLLELDERAQRRVLDPGHRRARRGAQPDGDRDRLVVVEQQRRHRRAGVQPVAAERARAGLDRIPERPQPLDVAADRAAGDLEPARELVARPVAAGLEQREELQQASGGLRHLVRTLAGIADDSCPKGLVGLRP